MSETETSEQRASAYPDDATAVELIDQLRDMAKTLVTLADSFESRFGRCGAMNDERICGLFPDHKGDHISLQGGATWRDN
jgi:hypothetical protein